MYIFLYIYIYIYTIYTFYTSIYLSIYMYFIYIFKSRIYRAVEADGSNAEHLGALAVVEMQLARRPGAAMPARVRP